MTPRKPIRFNVTARDIADGVRGNIYRCPLARSFQRVKGLDADSVGTSVLFCGRAGAWKTYLLPREAREFRDDFDAGRPVKPFRGQL